MTIELSIFKGLYNLPYTWQMPIQLTIYIVK